MPNRLVLLFCCLMPVCIAQAENKVPASLATAAKVSASSEESGKGNLAARAVDGNLATRWCAARPDSGEWLQLDFDPPRSIQSIRLHWESPQTAYRYRVDVTSDGTAWTTVLDRSKKPAVESGKALPVSAENVRALRVVYLGSATGAWGSLREVEVSSSPLKPLPEPPFVQRSDVTAPDGFQVSLFGVPPLVNYPVCLTAAPTGEVFVGVDEQGSLGKESGRGKILRCLDTNGDGQADAINEFAKIDHPRGLIYDSGTLWVLHPPTLSVLHDDNHDGVSDRQEVLIQGISTEDVARRGADHTTNGIQLGIDGWIYIAVGDYGVVEARGTDGTTLNRRGGGIIRVRPDGTEMEIYVWGLRNVLDACIDPMMNIFTRDNTNDGGGWDVRLSQIFQSAEYGYPSWYMNFHEDLMPPLADYGGGSGCGGLFLDDARWPKSFGHALYTADWGRSEVYVHHLTPAGPTFSADQQAFVKIPRPTDVDVDGSGRMYVSSWKGGQFNYAGPNVGFVAQIVPAGLELQPFPDLATLSPTSLIALFNSPDQKHRQHAQLELLRHGRSPETSSRLVEFLHDAQNTLFGRVAAIYTLAQLDGADSHAALIELAGVPELQASVLRALTDRRQLVKNLPSAPFLDGLKSRDPAVQAQALICIGRLGRVELAESVLPFSVRADGQAMTSHKHNEPDPGSVLPHLAVRTLVSLQATDACLKALSGPYRVGALNALKFMHLPAAVEGLIAAVHAAKSPQEQLQTLTALVRLYHQEAKYLKNWWGTRPDRTGPYYDRQVWSESPRIASTVAALFHAAAPAERQAILELLKKHQVEIPGVEGAPAAGLAATETNQPITLPKVDPGNKNQIANMSYEDALQRALKTPGNPANGAKLFEAQACIACHTYQAGQAPKGPHLADIGKRYPRPELIESILKPSAKIAQGFDTQVFMTVDGKVYTGFVSSEGAEDIQIRQSNGVSITLPKSQIEDRAKQEQSMMPVGIVNNLTPEQLADLLAWLESLKTR